MLDERRLNDEQMARGAERSRGHARRRAASAPDGLREHVAASCRDEFVWKLFQSWIDDEAPAKEKWAMGSIRPFGRRRHGAAAHAAGESLARRKPASAVRVRLGMLARIGSDAALMQLSGVAQKIKYKGLKTRAEQFVNDIAAQRGMTRAELEDRIVPDCGLDENGRREFSFGPRRFSFALTSELKPMLRDADGKLRSDLPKPTAKDDAAAAQQSLADWKLLKKQIREVARLQAARLEQAMITGRRWKTADFETLLVRHPLLGHLTRQLVWGAFDVARPKAGDLSRY